MASSAWRGPLAAPEIVPLAKRYGARIMVDEAHSLGVMGATAPAPRALWPDGRSRPEHGDFSKSFASIGGFVASEAKVVSYIKHNARSLMFSAALPPYAVATVQACLDILKTEPERRERLWRTPSS